MTVTLVESIGIAAATLLGGLLIAQWVLTRQLTALLRRPVVVSRGHAPKTVVVLCLRGADPFLDRTLSSLCEQDYPDYELRIVLDSVDDPAAAVVRQFLTRRPTPFMHVVTRRSLRTTCGLKCNSLLDAIEDLDPSVVVLALVDADVVPHRTWLAELVAPLEEPNVGITCGNRWYLPGTSWGSQFRYLWNVPAIVLMHWSSIAWGGSLAMRVSTLRRLNLAKRWEHTLCEDTPLQSLLRAAGLSMRFVPSLLMLNREECRLNEIIGWIRRQLLIVRLYHPAWPMVFAHGLATSTAWTIATAATIAAIAMSLTIKVWIIPAVACVVYFLGLVALLRTLERAALDLLRRRNETVEGAVVQLNRRTLPMILFTQFLYTIIISSVPFVRRIRWRQADYTVVGNKVALQNYRPFAIERTSVGSHSL